MGPSLADMPVETARFAELSSNDIVTGKDDSLTKGAAKWPELDVGPRDVGYGCTGAAGVGVSIASIEVGGG